MCIFWERKRKEDKNKMVGDNQPKEFLVPNLLFPRGNSLFQVSFPRFSKKFPKFPTPIPGLEFLGIR
ncbi:unnamed protein product [Meloidogyne enterolobii]|uniref:Uncharacterized protein n=1 Tax=Meloidogyne enterolobii TaxID=390850 RepID=A0ACB1AHC8_MELEN